MTEIVHMNKLKINISRLNDMLEQLSVIGRDEQGGITRLAGTEADKEARDLVVNWMKEAGLNVFIDRIGNIIGFRNGLENIKPLMVGSHIDTVISGGKFDGSYGVLAGLEIIMTLNDNKIKTKQPIALCVFTNEEGVRYSPDMMGSLVYANGLSVKEALRSINNEGGTLGQELQKIGYAGDARCGLYIPSHYIELHIEQGPILNMERIDVGIVDSLQGILWKEITILGESNHAGTTPINYRKDSGLAAANLILFLRHLCEKVGGGQVATCGKIRFDPNQINVIPGKVIMTVDLRNSDEAKLNEAEQLLDDYLSEVSNVESFNITSKILVRLHPIAFNEFLVSLIEKNAQKLGFTYRKMTSGAGHDAQMMARICPSAMIFVPSVDGISHSPLEYTPSTDIENGANLLLHTVLELANQDSVT
jgi:N-carbamoyl-L-amino-acid hydrolase